MTGREKLEAAFERARTEGRKAFIAYLCGGDPDVEESYRRLEACVEGGADVLELGIPFSDPTADGPTIQRASTRALAAGITLEDVLGLCRRLTERYPALPVILFGYYNPWHCRGVGSPAKLAAEAGAAGLLIVDLPHEESGALDAALLEAGLCRIYLVAPTTDPEREAEIASRATGFLYQVSLKGVTGTTLDSFEAVETQTRRLQALTDVPIAVGFGVDGPERAAAVARFADGVVVGSALVQKAHDAGVGGAQAVRDFVGALQRSLH